MAPASRPNFAFRAFMWLVVCIAFDSAFMYWINAEVRAYLWVLGMSTASENLHNALAWVTVFLIPWGANQFVAWALGVFDETEQRPRIVSIIAFLLPVLIIVTWGTVCNQFLESQCSLPP